MDTTITNMRKGLPLAKQLTKTFWGCAIGSCSVSMDNWTGSVDFGGMVAPIGVAVRAQGSIAFDHEGGVALIGSFGGGGSTPVATGGVSITATNAPSVNNLGGTSVQAGGTFATVFYAEGIAFTDNSNDQTYYGLSVAPLSRLSVTYFPPPVEGSIHGTVMHSSVFSVNVIDLFFAPLEWFLRKE